MKNSNKSIFRRISILVFSIITLLSVVFIVITYFASTYFYKASTELLNKDVATHIAKFTSPFENNGINKQKADSVFYNTMVLNPSSEVYFLDTGGNVIYYEETDSSVIQMNKIPLDEIKTFINSQGSKYVTGYDPRQAGTKKIFSAAPVYKNDNLLGYIYVILGSKEYGNANNMLFGSHAWNLALIVFITVVIISLLISFYYIRRLQHSYKKIIAVLDEYKSGNFTAQFNLKGDNEFAPITEAFSKMSNMLSANMNRLQKSEADRKDFIAAISHDLQAPLSVAKGYAETMLLHNNNTIKPEHHDYLRLIQSKITQVEKMVIQLAEISKLEEFNFKPKKEPFVLSEIVQETVNTFQLAASEKKAVLKCTQCQHHVWVNADVSMMERVIQNLVDNAVKNVNPSGDIQVKITLKDNMLVFAAANTGKYLPKELLQWINSNEEELADRPSNAGLGLLIVKKILRLHNTSLHACIENDKNMLTFKIPTVMQPAAANIRGL